MTPQRPGRVVVVGLVLMWGFSSVRAGDLHKSHCDTKSERVTLPSREVVVEQDRPRVTVRETTRAVRSRAAVTTMPVLGTVYMPMAVPMFGASRDLDAAPRAIDTNPLATAHQAELIALRNEQSRAALKAEIEASQRILARMSAGTPESISTDLQKIAADIKELKERANDIERLLVYHDNWIQKQAKSGGPSDETLKQFSERMKAVETLLNFHDNLIRQLPKPMGGADDKKSGQD